MARPASVFASFHDDSQRDAVIQLWKTHPNHFTRIRAHAILLSSQGFEVTAIVKIFSVCDDSVRDWIARFLSGGVEALKDADRPGGPPLLDQDEQQILRELLSRYPNHPAKVLAELERKTGKQISQSSLRNYARRFRLTWKRFRRSLRKKRDAKAFSVAREE